MCSIVSKEISLFKDFYLIICNTWVCNYLVKLVDSKDFPSLKMEISWLLKSMVNDQYLKGIVVYEGFA